MLKCCQHLHLLFENVTINQDVDEDYSLEIFEMTTRTNEPQRSLSVGNLWFKNVSNEYEIYQVFSLMVGEAWIYVFYSCIPCPSNLKHCWFTIWNWMNFFFGENIYWS